MKKHLNITIHGDVQGVFFRDSAKEQAEELGIHGFARNEASGAVYIEAEGEEEDLRKFSEWCKRGPEFASVDRVGIEEKPLQNFQDFQIVF